MAARLIGAASPKHAEQLRLLGEFYDADEVRYVDHGKAEDYFIVKDGKTLKLAARGNYMDGGFLSVSVVDEPKDKVEQAPRVHRTLHWTEAPLGDTRLVDKED